MLAMILLCVAVLLSQSRTPQTPWSIASVVLAVLALIFTVIKWNPL